MMILSLVAAVFAQDWKETLEKVKPAVVSIRVSATRSFDTEEARFSYATGFIVDAERGIILTNRHVVQPGPVVAEAVLQNNEEIALRPLYRDPVHDFGFFSYDPESIQFLDVSALPLAPGGARLDEEVRVIGNDAGEKGSILPGIISRLDRLAPAYGRGRYNDFNTFYIQSVSGTSGGSSGSPVVNIHGQAVALNAGSKRSAGSSYFLPLDKVVTALRALQEGDTIARGTLQTTFRWLPFDEVRRRGIRPELEVLTRQRFPDATGMLVVDEILPGGPAHGVLETGDVLVSINGAPLTTYLPLEEALDSHVGESITAVVERSGAAKTLTLTVGDLHAITPASFLEVSGAILHPLSYQIARSYGLAVRGVFVASPGYALSVAGISENSVITEINGETVDTLEEVGALLSAQPDGALIRVRLFHVNNPWRERVEVVRLDRRWHPMQQCDRDDAHGAWACTALPDPPVSPAPAPVETTFVGGGDRPSRALASSLVMVDFDIPYRTDGVYGSFYKGVGLVVDAEAGLVAVDRDTVPVMLGDARLTFAGSVDIPATVVWVHPEHNISLLRYDPALLGSTPVRSAVLRETPLEVGDRIWQVGISSDNQIVSRESEVERIRNVSLPLPRVPFFRETNVELIDPQDVVSSMGGALTDRRGRVVATWASFVDLSSKDPSAYLYGLPAEVLAEAMAVWRGTLHSLGAELAPISLSEARSRGLPAAQATALEGRDPRRQVLEVVRVIAGTPAAEHLKGGDLILAADGQLVTTPRAVELASRGPNAQLTILREGAVAEVVVPTVVLPPAASTRVVGWAGATLQQTPLAVASQRGHPATGVYVSWYWYGSPAAQYGLQASRRIVAVDGQPTPDLDTFLALTASKEDRGAVQLTTERLDGRREVITLRLDLTYWPTFELRDIDGVWTRTEL